MKRFLVILLVVLFFGAVLFNLEEISTTLRASKELVSPNKETAFLVLERVQEVSLRPGASPEMPIEREPSPKEDAPAPLPPDEMAAAEVPMEEMPPGGLPPAAAEAPPPEAPEEVVGEGAPMLLLYMDSPDEIPSDSDLRQVAAEEIIQNPPDDEAWIREYLPEINEDQLNAYRELLLRIIKENVVDFFVGMVKGLPRDILVSAFLSFVSSKIWPFGKKKVGDR